jgi:hypothetical protein
MEYIFITSPIRKLRVIIGEFRFETKTVVFYIRKGDIFEKANAVGVDRDTFKRKSIRWCNKIVLKFWDNRRYEMPIDEFIMNSWIYPPKNDPNYKASPDVFKSKLMIPLEKLELLGNPKPKSEEERLKDMCRDGVFG